MADVFTTIRDRFFDRYKINIGKYIYHAEDPKSRKRISTLKVGPTTLEGISFVAQSEVIRDGKPVKVVGIDDLTSALERARNGGARAFAGQIREDDRNHKLLQASFGVTEGLGFREIFYLSQLPQPARDPGAGNVLDSGGRSYDAKFGKMTDSVDITSLHAALLGPINNPGGAAAIRRGFSSNKAARSSIHLDEKGFVFADSDGRIFISSNVVQHLGDELGIKDILFDGNSPLSFFFHTDSNSISNPTLGSLDMRGNNFLRNRAARGVLGLELSTKPGGLQLFARGSLGVESRGLQSPKFSDWSGVVGVRGRF